MDHVMDFIYDNNGAPYAMKYDGTEYYYVLNLQGDVIRIIDTTGASVAEYIYDAWGRPVSATGTMAEVNPIRYRGYYFDSDSGLYYLQSRYYDPEIKRFINADIVCDKRSFVGLNLFAYCWNSPISLCDYDGFEATSIFLSIGLMTGLGDALSSIMISLEAAVSGLCTALSTSAFIPICIAAASVAIAGLIYAANKAIEYEKQAQATVSTVYACVSRGGIDEKKLKNNSVYVIQDNHSKKVIYVGRTSNFSARKAAHQAGKYPASLYKIIPIATNLTLAESRALEQTLISAFTLDCLNNMINSIACKKWSQFDSEFLRMQSLIESWENL